MHYLLFLLFFMTKYACASDDSRYLSDNESCTSDSEQEGKDYPSTPDSWKDASSQLSGQDELQEMCSCCNTNQEQCLCDTVFVVSPKRPTTSLEHELDQAEKEKNFEKKREQMDKKYEEFLESVQNKKDYKP